jgi:glycosyltransferase involved in cell wall biosynthesis
MRLLYLLERPIQNDLPYLLLAKENCITVTVLCIEEKNGKLSKNENINQSVFANDQLYKYPYKFLKQGRSLFTYLWRSDVVVVYGHFHPIFRKAILLSKILGKRLVLTSDASSLQGISGSDGWKLKVKPFLFRFLYNSIADALFVPSSASENYFKKIGINADKIVLTPYTVNEQFLLNRLKNSNLGKLRELLGLCSNEVVFLFCGKLIPRKKAADLLKALALVADSSARVIIIGDGPEKNALETLSKNLEISGQVIFTGLVAYHELAAYYAMASVLIVPAEHEPYGLPVNEAMICGTPVITSNAVGSAGDLIEDGLTGYTYSVGDIESLSQKMSLFSESPQLKTTLAENCKLKMKSWNSQSNVDAQLHFFKFRGWLT